MFTYREPKTHRDRPESAKRKRRTFSFSMRLCLWKYKALAHNFSMEDGGPLLRRLVVAIEFQELAAMHFTRCYLAFQAEGELTLSMVKVMEFS
jgi:hypothetical protein